MCVCGTVIGFVETEYEVVERSESYQFTLGVVQGSLAQNLSLTVISTPITAGIYIYCSYILHSADKECVHLGLVLSVHKHY